MVDININIKVPAAEKLLDMTASGVGAVAAPLLLRWNSHEQAGAIQRITQAQEKAREIFKASGSVGAFKAEIVLAECAQSSVQFQQEKRIANVGSVVQEAKTLLGDKEVPNKPVDPDWSARFFDDVKDVSSDQLRSIWAALLAGEIEAPGQSSLRTLNVLKGLRQSELHIFNRVASYVIDDGKKPAIFNCFRKHMLLVGEQSQKKIINYEEYLQLQESGLFMSGEGASWNPENNLWGECCGVMLASFQKNGRGDKKEANIPVVLLTQAGREIARCGTFLLDEDYLACIAGHLKLQGYELYAANILKRGETLSEHSLEEWQLVSDQRK